ncbi:MAG: DUF2953 domain-containing protein [Oscillibacter sp.]|nr:DUF2953 domain-containing protein [Oscillibacter sp.]
MPALWVLAVVALLLILILSIRLRVLFTAKGDALTLEVRAAFFRYRVLPPPEEKPPEKKKPAPEKPKEPAPKRTVTQTVQRLLALVDRFWGPVTGVLRNIRGAIRVDPLSVHVTYGGRDEPADAAILCGDTLAAVWAVMPVLEALCRIPRPRITVDTDFDAPNNVRLDAEIGLTLRVWALLVSLLPLLALLRKQK